MRTIEEAVAELRKDIHSDVYLGKKTIGTYLDEILEIHNAEKTEWIPVSKRLPETDADVLVTNGEGMLFIGWIVPTDKSWRVNSESEYFMKNIIAWMPLPEPYKAESEDCRDCKKWEDCPCGKKGHERETSQGYSIGECEDFEPKESDHKCHTCKHYTSGEHDGSCGSYICKEYSNWESEDKE